MSENMLQRLLELIPLAGPDAPAFLPETGAISYQEIDQLFAQISARVQGIQQDNQKFSEELIDCYHQLNMAFDATTAVAACKEISEALAVLMEKIAQAVQSHFTFFLGRPAFESNWLNHKIDGNLIHAAPERREAARAYFSRHEQRLRELPATGRETEVIMLDYHGAPDDDHQGRGNVLAVRLEGGGESIGPLGTIIFTRSDEQKPFVAVEMNLALSLARTGAAVLSNIIYAQKLHQTYLQTIAALARAMETKDPYTSGHSSRVAQLACALGAHIGLSREEIELLEWAGLMHDIGKIGIRDEVLCKAGKLTPEEFNHIKSHALNGYIVLEPLEALQRILAAVRYHHENFNGHGYPDGLAGENIPLYARILRVADIWDALISNRSYRPAMSIEQAEEIMHGEADITMDPALVNAFLEMIQQREDLRRSFT